MISKWWALVAGGLGLAVIGARAAARGGAAGEAVILAPGVTYQPTMDEWLWFARSLSAESGSREGQLAAGWAMVQRFCAFEQRDPATFATFGAMVRAFSQPVNPIWSAVDACTPDGRGCCGRRCTQADVERRLRIQARSWSDLRDRHSSAYELAQAFAQGRPPRNPIPGYTNFAACWAAPGLEIGGNCFSQSPPVEGPVEVIA